MVDIQAEYFVMTVDHNKPPDAILFVPALIRISSIDIIPSFNVVRPDEFQAIQYDVIIGSFGVAGAPQVIVNTNHIDVDSRIPQDDPVFIAGFFTNTFTDATNKLIAIPRNQTNKTIHYDMFFPSSAVGTVDYDLFVFTSEKPPGEFLGTLPTLPSDPVFSTVSARSRGGKIVFDYFVLVAAA